MLDNVIWNILSDERNFLRFSIQKMFFFALLMMFAENLSDTVNYILAAVNLVTPLLFCKYRGINNTRNEIWRTILGDLAAMIVFSKWIFIDSQTLKPILYISLSETVRVIKYSFVHASLYLYIGFGNIILNIFFLKTFGEQNFPVLSVIVSILQFGLFLEGVAEASEPPINVYFGEKNLDCIKK